MIHKVDAFWVYGPMFRQWCIWAFWQEVAICALLDYAKRHCDLDHDVGDGPEERKAFVEWFFEGWH